MSPETLKTDVLIIGKGVSGLLLNLLLGRRGISSILLSKNNIKSNLPLAETIPPSTLELLEKIDALHFFENNATKTYGYQSKWNSNYITDESFFLKSKFGYGLKLNKRNVIKTLENASSNILPADEISKIIFKEDYNIVSVKETNNQTKNVHASLIIDATGRKRHLLKQANSTNIDYDDTLAFLCYLPKTGPDLKYGFFTESFSENCWGTVSDLNETTRIVSLYTSKSNRQHKSFKNFCEWKNLLSDTEILKLCIPAKGNFKVYGRQANSSISSKITTKNILGIGDAAIAFDPISSHGVSNAIYTAKEAATAIEKHLKNNARSLFEYEEKMYTLFNEYLKQKEKLYHLNH